MTFAHHHAASQTAASAKGPNDGITVLATLHPAASDTVISTLIETRGIATQPLPLCPTPLPEFGPHLVVGNRTFVPWDRAQLNQTTLPSLPAEIKARFSTVTETILSDGKHRWSRDGLPTFPLPRAVTHYRMRTWTALSTEFGTFVENVPPDLVTAHVNPQLMTVEDLIALDPDHIWSRLLHAVPGQLLLSDHLEGSLQLVDERCRAVDRLGRDLDLSVPRARTYDLRALYPHVLVEVSALYLDVPLNTLVELSRGLPDMVEVLEGTPAGRHIELTFWPCFQTLPQTITADDLNARDLTDSRKVRTERLMREDVFDRVSAIATCGLDDLSLSTLREAFCVLEECLASQAHCMALDGHHAASDAMVSAPISPGRVPVSCPNEIEPAI